MSGNILKNGRPLYLDLHVHIGRDGEGQAVKITASSRLTLPNILRECVERKGINLVGIVDCATAGVLKDMKKLLATGELVELSQGGWSYRGKLTLFAGAELETVEANGGRAHQLCYFPSMNRLEDFARFIWQKVKNNRLSSQVCYLSARQLWEAVKKRDGFLIPAHVFTPFKSIYGNCAASLSAVFGDFAHEITAIELGLSADREMALRIPELQQRVFLANSDAHSLEKIGREYNVVSMEKPCFDDLVSLLKGQKGRIIANYGLDPRLGKYHRSFCNPCERAAAQEAPPVFSCPSCGEKKDFVVGVLDKIVSIGAWQHAQDIERSKGQLMSPDGKYYYQIPLDFLPGLGKKTKEKLLQYFNTEMNILHRATETELTKIAGAKIAKLIIKGRRGELQMTPGAGGIYGRIKDSL